MSVLVATIGLVTSLLFSGYQLEHSPLLLVNATFISFIDLEGKEVDVVRRSAHFCFDSSSLRALAHTLALRSLSRAVSMRTSSIGLCQIQLKPSHLWLPFDHSSVQLFHDTCPPMLAVIVLPDASHHLDCMTELAAAAVFQQVRMLHIGSPVSGTLQLHYLMEVDEPDDELVPIKICSSLTRSLHVTPPLLIALAPPIKFSFGIV
jgi:hypothetical protein